MIVIGNSKHPAARGIFLHGRNSDKFIRRCEGGLCKQVALAKDTYIDEQE